jgi:uncharacterized protein (DUF2235 family)
MRFNKQWRQDAHRILTIFGGLGMAEPEIATHRKRRLAVFLDGTWNAVDTNTNVWRMKSLCATKGTDDADQLIFYAKGVNGFWGGVFGKGLDDVIQGAYEWLIDQYVAGDEIFIFGFSRGAYAARSLAGLITKCGLLSRNVTSTQAGRGRISP